MNEKQTEQMVTISHDELELIDGGERTTNNVYINIVQGILNFFKS